MAKNNSNGKNIVFVIGFLIMAVILVIFCHWVSGMMSTDSQTAETENITVTSVTTKAETSVTEDEPEVTSSVSETEALPVETSSHISPARLVESEISSVKYPGVSVDTFTEESKVYLLDLREIAEAGDIIESFTFTFHSENDIPFNGELKAGYGVTVDNSCPDKTKDAWYQPTEYSIVTDNSACTVVWMIPDEIKDYITISNGQVMFGFWWSEHVNTVILDKVECHRKTLREVPVDGENTIALNKTISSDGADNKITVPVSELTGAENELQTIELTFEGSDVLSDISGHFGVDTTVLNDEYVNSLNMTVSSEENISRITWIIPDAVKHSINKTGNIEFMLERCNLPDVTVKDIVFQYSLG